jgi:hypothetical protein
LDYVTLTCPCAEFAGYLCFKSSSITMRALGRLKIWSAWIICHGDSTYVGYEITSLLPYCI